MFRTLRVPRSGSMIFTMLVALVATAVLPIIFMAALAASAESHPRPLLETLKELGHPLASSAARLWSRVR
jgi:hypothetical protein